MELLISPEEISQKIKEAAAVLDEEYRGKELAILAVMKGSICVAADLMRALHVPATIECISASSYGMKGMSRGDLKISGIEHLDLSTKDILVVDDIFDTGNTLEKIVSEVREKNPKSLKSLVLLLKKVPRKITYRPDYVLFEIEDRFVIGYGLDYKEYFRGLPGVYAFVNDTPPEAHH